MLRCCSRYSLGLAAVNSIRHAARYPLRPSAYILKSWVEGRLVARPRGPNAPGFQGLDPGWRVLPASLASSISDGFSYFGKDKKWYEQDVPFHTHAECSPGLKFAQAYDLSLKPLISGDGVPLQWTGSWSFIIFSRPCLGHGERGSGYLLSKMPIGILSRAYHCGHARRVWGGRLRLDLDTG